MTGQVDGASKASIVIEYDGFPGDKESQFRQWQSEIQSGVSQFEGYLGTDIFPPVKKGQDGWYIVVHFDSHAYLSQWLDSDTRHYLINKGRRKFGAYRYRIGTGLEGWFSKGKNQDESPNPPAWKQIFSVLFGLYPTVMVETLAFAHFRLMESWSIAPKMFVNNLVSCCLLTLVVMPLVTSLLNFWLKPQRSTPKINVIGTLLVFIGYGFMISIFHLFSQMSF